MSHPLIHANIVDLDSGANIRVRLHGIPRVGQLVDLWPIAKTSSSKHYEVVQVIHKIDAVTNNLKNEQLGDHCATLFVTSSESDMFDKD